jgi:midasin
MIEYLAARCGYKCVRINNHEHTDVQEYIGGNDTLPLLLQCV